MARSKPVHECLFCPQTFDSATAKDDHVLEHFAQETCMECNQHLIRIGNTLYSQHNSTTCIKIGVKSEVPDQRISDIPSASGNVNQYDGPVYGDNYPEADVLMLTSIEMDEIHIKDEPNEGGERQDSFERLNDFEAHSNYSSTPKVEWTDFQPEDNTVAWNALHFDDCDKNALEEDKQQTIILTKKSTASMEKGKISCDICGKVLGSKRTLYAHKTLLHSQLRHEFECYLCKMKLKTKVSLRKHMLVKHDPDKEKLKCKLCGQVYKNELSLQTHTCRSNESCDVCGKTFKTRQSLRRHTIRFHSPKGTIFCNLCAKIFHCVEDLNKHRPNCYRDTQEPCDICGKLLKNGSLKKHNILFHSPPGTIFCNVCGRLFSTIEERDTHRSICNLKQTGRSGRFECNICKAILTFKSSFRKHMIAVHDPCADRLKCKQCKRVFIKESSLQAHTCKSKKKKSNR